MQHPQLLDTGSLVGYLVNAVRAEKLPEPLFTLLLSLRAWRLWFHGRVRAVLLTSEPLLTLSVSTGARAMDERPTPCAARS